MSRSLYNPDTRIFFGFFWVLIAIFAGVASVALPPVLVLAVVLGSILICLMGITPLAALTMLLVLAPLRTLITTESPLQLPLDIGQILFLFFVFVWALHRILHQKTVLIFQTSPIYIPILLFLMVGGLTVFSATSLTAWLTEWLKWWIIVAMVTFILNLGRGANWEWIAFAVVLSGVANACVGLYIYFGGSGADHLLINDNRFRAFGTFGQPNPFGGFLGLIIPISLMMFYGYTMRIIHHRRIVGKWHFRAVLPIIFYATATLLMLGGVFASWSRGAWLGLIVALGAITFALPRKTWRSVALLASGAVMLGVLWFSGLLPDSVTNRITSSTAEFFAFDDVRGVDITPDNYAVVERLAHWQAALNMAQAHPWLGVGLGNYEIVYDQFRLLNWHFPLGHAHNYYLNILAEAGIIGLFGYGLLWGSIVGFTWKARRLPDILQRAMAVGLLGTWVYLAFHSLLDNLYVNNVFIHLGTLLGLLALIYKNHYHTITYR